MGAVRLHWQVETVSWPALQSISLSDQHHFGLAWVQCEPAALYLKAGLIWGGKAEGICEGSGFRRELDW